MKADWIGNNYNNSGAKGTVIRVKEINFETEQNDKGKAQIASISTIKIITEEEFKTVEARAMKEGQQQDQENAQDQE